MGFALDRKMIVSFLAFVALACAGAEARSQTFACQYLDVTGFVWRSGAWKQTNFNADKKFFLVMQGDSIDPKSLEPLDFLASDTTCAPIRSTLTGDRGVHCADDTYTLIFHPRRSEGVFTRLHGGLVEKNGERDSISIATFICTSMR